MTDVSNKKNIHFIAIGGSAMHNLAIALSRKGFNVSGSDDEIFNPSRSRLKKEGILPNVIGWNPDKITKKIDAVILGMHARIDNPELIRAKKLNIPIYSYPEYLYEQSKFKKRIVIGGSHGKTTITSMILHVANIIGLDLDYMVGAELEGYDCMVKITDESNIIILEGDEYLSSPIDHRPKFHLYKPHAAIITGISWDHINVFPTFINYLDQFDNFCKLIQDGGTLVYNVEDVEVNKLGEKYSDTLETIPYKTPKYDVVFDGTIIHLEGNSYNLKIFGEHNLQNLMGAMVLGHFMGISRNDFLNAMSSFKGAANRLQKVSENKGFLMFKDFAHSPSKLRATTIAVKEQFPSKKVIACMELHTFSSLKKDFLSQYKDCMSSADESLVYFSPEVIKHKSLDPISLEDVYLGFGGGIKVVNHTNEVISFILSKDMSNTVLLMMSSGNFDGIDYAKLAKDICN